MAASSRIYSSCSSFCSKVVSFTELVQVAGERRQVSFEKTVIWLKVSESILEYWHGGLLLKVGELYGDSEGYLTSMEEGATFRGEALAQTFGITAESSLELRLRTGVSLIPVTQSLASEHENNAHPERIRQAYDSISSHWRTSIGGAEPARLNEIKVGEATTWTSKHTREQNEKTLTEFKASWSSTLPFESLAQGLPGIPQLSLS